MNIAELLKGIDCSCGKHHACDIGYVAIERGAIDHLKKLCEGKQNVLLVADENTYKAAGQQTMAALAGKTLRSVIFSGATILIPNEEAVAEVEKKLEGIDVIVGIGSGVIQDLCKYVSFNSGIPYYIVATAPSMDGYASSGAAMIMGGMKVTYSAKVPDAILADPVVLKDAPFPMIQAGYGDIVGKYSALNDWKLSHAVKDEYFCQYIYDLTFDMLKKTLELAAGLVQRDEESVKVLMEALVGVGIAMSFAGNSRPASGSEHHLSHYFEITGIVTDTEYLPHGIDVAYSTVKTAEIREALLSRQWPAVSYRQERSEYEAAMKAVYHEVAEGCIALQDKVGHYAADRMPIYLAKEEEIRAILAEHPKASEIEAMLTAVGMSMDEFYKIYDTEKIEKALVYAKDLKDRYTVLWMHYDMMG
ncbi:MAG: sn-glycerol-1-phosphate dehydrogenase [Firmicutes bacterium]|nr:sn-glycerol-1-phosphate dehydrogenase [Bacillota bacterium]